MDVQMGCFKPVSLFSLLIPVLSLAGKLTPPSSPPSPSSTPPSSRLSRQSQPPHPRPFIYRPQLLRSAHHIIHIPTVNSKKVKAKKSDRGYKVSLIGTYTSLSLSAFTLSPLLPPYSHVNLKPTPYNPIFLVSTARFLADETSALKERARAIQGGSLQGGGVCRGLTERERER
jgi:hypothetical protein